MRLDEITGWIDDWRIKRAIVDYYNDNWKTPDEYTESQTKDRDGYPYQFSKKWNLGDGWQLEYFKDIRGNLIELRQGDEAKVGWVYNNVLGTKDDVIIELTLDEVQSILGAST